MLGKYLFHYKLRRSLKLKKPEKLSIVRRHVKQTHAVIGGVDEEQTDDTDTEVEANDSEEEDESDSSGGNSDDDEVVDNTYMLSESSVEESSSDEEADPVDAASVLTTTSRGRVARNWRAAQYVSPRIYVLSY